MALSSRTPRHLTIAALAALAAGLTLALAVSPAATGATAFCPGSTEQPFLPWLDPMQYMLAPGGDFESRASSWTLEGGAKLVTGNESYRVHGSMDARSLSIPAGASATTPSFCVGLGDPTLRLFARGGSSGSGLKVEVVYTTALGTVTQPVGTVSASTSWEPTLPLLLLANATGLTSLDGLTSSVRLRFTSVGAAGWQIDDVYVDPFKVH